jgi:hypothetical protein
MYNPNKQQVYIKKNVLTAGLEEALGVFLHEANHHVSGSDDMSREFADSMCRMLANLLLRYSTEMGIKAQVRITETEIILPVQFMADSYNPTNYATIIAMGNRLYINIAFGTVEIELPLVLATPISCTKKILDTNHGYMLKLPGKLSSVLAYAVRDLPLDCIIKFNH